MPGESEINTENNQVILSDIEATSGVCYYGRVSGEVTGSETTSFYCSGLSGWGDDDFIHLYYAQIRRTTDGKAPEYEVRRITDYVSSTGQFTVGTAFSANVNTNDTVNIIHESLKEMMDSPSLELEFAQSQSGSVEEGGQLHFHVGIANKDSGNLGVGKINIGSATLVLERQRTTGAFSNAGITQPSLYKAVGRVYSNCRFHKSQWREGDMYKLTLSTITVSIDGETGYIPTFVWSGKIDEASTSAQSLLNYTQSPSGTAEEGGMIEFNVSVEDKYNGPVGSGKIDISGATIDFERQRGTGGFSGTGITDPTLQKNDGEFYMRTRFHATEWSSGDMYRMHLSGVTVTIDDETVTLPPFVWSGTVLEMADLSTKVDRIDDNVSDIEDEVEDLSEAPQLCCSLQTFLERPQSGDEYVRVEVMFSDLDGDMADPYTNVLGVFVLNSGSTSRTGNCYKDVAGVAQLDLVGGAGALALYRELERSAQGNYYFFYKVADDAALEELIFRFGWTEAGLYYEDTEYSYHVEGSQIVSQLNDPNQERDYETTEDLNQAAGTYDLFTATGGDMRVNSLIIRMPNEACSGSVTSISIQTDTTTAHTFVSSASGAVGNLTAEAELAGDGPKLLKSGEKIQITIAGGAHGSTYTTEIHVEAEPLDAGAYLA